MSELPWLVRWIVNTTTPKHWQESLLGDLEESLRADRGAGKSLGAAQRRALAEALRSARDTLRPAADPPPLSPIPSKRRPGDTAVIAFLNDLGFAVRGLRRAPTFTLVVVMTLALGIGCVTAFASLFDAVLLRPLPFDESDRLVRVSGQNTERPGGRRNSSYPDYADFVAGTDAFESLTILHTNFSNLVENGVAPKRVPSTFTSANFLQTLGLPVALGREFTAADNQPGAEPSVLISSELWQLRYGGSADVIGKVIRVDGVLRTIVGVAPAGLTFPIASDLWLPIQEMSGVNVRGVHSSNIIGRLKKGVELETAQQQLSAVAARLEKEYPRSNAQLGVRAEPLLESLVERVRARLFLVAAAAGILLLVVCANISSLLLERTTRRRRELATRAALGASHGQLTRFFLAESLILVSLGVAMGLLVASAARQLLIRFGPELPRSVEPSLDWRALLFASGLSALIGVLFALIPALSALGRDLFHRLRVSGVGAQGRRDARWRSAFVVIQVALAVTLTLGAALLVQSLHRLYDVDLGFDPESILTVDLEVSTPWVSDEWPKTVAFYEQLIERLEALPGVKSAAASHHHPANPGWATSFRIFGQPEPPPGLSPKANFRPVTAGYFKTAGIPVVHGRVFDETVSSEGPGQVVVNQAFVDAYLEGGDALGQRMVRDNWWIPEITDYEIIGVVADTRFVGRHRPSEPAMYLPHRQDIPPVMTLLIQTENGLDPLSLAPALPDVVWALNPEMPIGRISTLEELVDGTVSVRRFLTFLLTAFAAVTLGLAALGLYGALAYATARRTRELGLRIALGARAGHLHAMVLSQGLRLTAIGVTIGLLGAVFASRAFQAMLFEIQPGDPTTFAAVTLLLAVVAFGAGWIPAWRATRVDPCRALAEE